MDNTLDKLADHVKDKEYRELFENTPVEEAKEDEEKVKEALYQVYGVIFNKELYNYCEENSHVTPEELDEMAENDTQRERISQGIGAVTVTEEDGKTLIPSTDVKYALTKKQRFWD